MATNGTTNGLANGRPAPPKSDPAIYQAHHDRFKAEGHPTKGDAWIARAADVSKIFAEDAYQREKEHKSPFAEVALLKSSGLTQILGPKKYDGGEQPWDIAFKVIRKVAEGDGSLGMLLGYHLLWSWTSAVVGTDEQNDRTQKLIIENNYFLGGAVNPRDEDQKIKDGGDHVVFSGLKHFNTGGVVSDLTVLEGAYEGTDKHIFALAPTNQEGINFFHNWDNIGLQLTESGSVNIDNIKVPWEDALGWDPKTKAPIEGVLTIPWATLLLPTIQLVFSNFYLGIALGSLSHASTYTAKNTRPWPYTPRPAPSGPDEPYILQRYGSFLSHLRAATALADVAGAKLADIYTNHSPKRDVTAEQRGDVAEWVASTKIVATDTALEVTSGVFEVTGARATGGKVGLERYWRDVRTHTLHDPVAYKREEVGRWQVKGEWPEPTWYT